jgi:hypothetical protein
MGISDEQPNAKAEQFKELKPIIIEVMLFFFFSFRNEILTESKMLEEY